MTTIRVMAYQKHSRSAKDIAKRLGVLLATEKQIEKYKDFDHIINWGSTAKLFEGDYLNHPDNVSAAVDKMATLRLLDEHDVVRPVYTDDQKLAHTWWMNGETVVCRKLLRASKGRGMVLASREKGIPIVAAPLYTMYKKKADEYRVHCVRGEIIDVQMKRKRREVNNDAVNYQVRNVANGWVFCRGGIDAPVAVRDAGIAAVRALGLDFGGVDIGYNRKEDKACVYEVNTAPGVHGSTLDHYYRAFSEILPQIKGGAYAQRRLKNVS